MGYEEIVNCRFTRRGDNKHTYFVDDAYDSEDGGITIEVSKFPKNQTERGAHSWLNAVLRWEIEGFEDDYTPEELALYYSNIEAFFADFEKIDCDELASVECEPITIEKGIK